MLKFLVAIPLIAHGLANLAGVFAPWTKSLQGFADAPWIFSSGVTYNSWVGRAFSLLWLASSLCLVGAGVGVFTHQPWWLLLAILGCAFSAAAILPWWKAVPPGARFGGIFDLVVLGLLLSPLGAQIAKVIQ